MGTVDIIESSAFTHCAEENRVFPLAASLMTEKLNESAQSQSASVSNPVMSSNALEIQQAMEAPHGALSADAPRALVASRSVDDEDREHFAMIRPGECGSR